MTTANEDGEYTSIQPPQVTQLPAVPTPSDVPADASITIGSIQEPELPPATITVYADRISPVSYASDSPVVAFDVVFSVSISCPDSGSTETYQVVKRIGVDRQKLAADAKATTPVSIVEAKKPTPADVGVGASTARLKALAGLK